jgi:hypothetical protein
LFCVSPAPFDKPSPEITENSFSFYYFERLG